MQKKIALVKGLTFFCNLRTTIIKKGLSHPFKGYHLLALLMNGILISFLHYVVRYYPKEGNNAINT